MVLSPLATNLSERHLLMILKKDGNITDSSASMLLVSLLLIFGTLTQKLKVPCSRQSKEQNMDQTHSNSFSRLERQLDLMDTL